MSGIRSGAADLIETGRGGDEKGGGPFLCQPRVDRPGGAKLETIN